jgi:hypothetical protein
MNEFVARNGIIAQNNSTVTGSLTVTGGITGSVFGTASWAQNAITASFIRTAQTASYVLQAVSSSYALTSSFASSGNGPFSGSFSGSGADLFGIPASGIVGLNLSQIATGSVTASVSPTQFSVTSGSSTELVVTGTGVTIGSALTDTHTITGSLFITGSIEDGGSGHILTYNTQSGQIFFTASSAIGGGGVTSLGSGSFGATFDGAGGVVAINKTVYVRVPTAISMSSWEMVSQPTGSCVVSVFADSYGNYPPTSPTDDIFSVYPSISLASASRNTSPTFVTSNVLPAGSWVGFRTVSVTGSVWISISVNGVKA